MWVIEGAFDSEAGNLERRKTKLLKPGRSYPLGRKGKDPLQLVLSNPKISAEHVTFVVAEHPVANIDDPHSRPTLTIQNKKNKALQISREINGMSERVMLQALAEDALCSGDVIALVTGIYVKVYWKQVCCYSAPRTSAVPLARCAALGLKVVSTLQPEVTHHLTPTLSATIATATSLLIPASFVLPDWLTELLHLGETTTSPDGPSSLEQDLRLPPESDYRPPFDPSLPALMQSILRWEPSNERVGLLKGWRFLFVGERGRELDTECRTLLERGGGEYETFDIAGGTIRWKQALARNARKAEADGGKGLCVIGDGDALQLVAPGSWEEMRDLLKSQGLRLYRRSDLIDSIFFSDTDRLRSTALASGEEESPLPSIVPNTHEVQSVSPVSSQSIVTPQGSASSNHPNLRKRTVSAIEDRPAAEEAAPIAVEARPAPVRDVQPSRESAEPEVRRKPLVKRARTHGVSAHLFSADGASVTQSEVPGPETQNRPAASKPDSSGKPVSQASATTGRPGLLRKRANDGAQRNPFHVALDKEAEKATDEEPPHKRYQELFDETDPDRLSSQPPPSGAFSGGIADSQMYSQVPMGTQEGGALGAVSGLAAVPEEEEVEPAGPTTSDTGLDATMHDADNEGPLSPRKRAPKPVSTASAAGPSQSQRPPVSSTQMLTMSKTASSKVGAAPGSPDTDAAFLKALASTKKGKRREDDFDREFNNLRIVVPEREKDDRAEDWKLLTDFGDESNLLGNFMVIVEMDVPEHSKSAGQSSRAQSREAESPVWRGKPDFKKFKKKTNARPRPAVELVVDNENDYGMGAGYWKNGSQSQSQSQSQLPLPQANGIDANGETQQQRGQSYLQPSQSQNRGFLQAPAPAQRGKKSQTQTQSLFQSQARTQGKAKGKTPEPDAELETPALRTRSQGGSRAKGKQVILSDVDEDVKDFEANGKTGSRRQAGADGSTVDQPLFLNESGDAEPDLDLDDLSVVDVDVDDDDNGGDSDPPTLPSQSQRSARSTKSVKSKPGPDASTTKGRTRTTNAKKRAADLMDDDSDTGVAFTGFGGRAKRGRAVR